MLKFIRADTVVYVGCTSCIVTLKNTQGDSEVNLRLILNLIQVDTAVFKADSDLTG